MKGLRHMAAFVLVISTGLAMVGQDIHFSQFYMSPMSLNPALAGNFDVEYRFAVNQRTQWRSVTDSPYSTFSLSAENSGTFGMEQLGTGLFILNDRAGDGVLNTLVIDLIGAYAIPMNADSSSHFRIGSRVGFTQRSLDYSALRFDSQFNGLAYDGQLPSLEDVSNDRVSHMNFDLGLTFVNDIDGRQSYMLGIGLFNLLSPDVGFTSDEQVPLDQRLNLFGQYEMKLADDWDFIPAAQGMWQGSYQEILIGARFRYIWEDDARALRRGYIGGSGRLGDGAFATIGIDYDAWSFGVSYDLNFSPLEVASRNRGGLELAAIYLLDIFNEKRKVHRACPAWL